MSDNKEKNQEAEINDEKLEKRRKALKNILAGSGTVVTAAAMQDKWAKPVIESVVLPAHAETSIASFSVTLQASLDRNEILDLFVPTAHADTTSTTTTTTTTTTPSPSTPPPGTTGLPPTGLKDICINVSGTSAAVQVTLQNTPSLFTGNLTLDFADTPLVAEPASPYSVSISGAIANGGNSVKGTLVINGAPEPYDAPKNPIACNLSAPVVPG